MIDCSRSRVCAARASGLANATPTRRSYAETRYRRVRSRRGGGRKIKESRGNRGHRSQGVCRFCHVDSAGWSVITVVSASDLIRRRPLPTLPPIVERGARVCTCIPRCARNPVKMQIPAVSPSRADGKKSGRRVRAVGFNRGVFRCTRGEEPGVDGGRGPGMAKGGAESVVTSAGLQSGCNVLPTGKYSQM